MTFNVVIQPQVFRLSVPSSVWRVAISGARGESAADVARRILAEPPYSVTGADGFSDLDALEAVFGAPQSFLPETLAWILAVEAQAESPAERPTFGRMLDMDLLFKDLVALDAWSVCDGVWVQGEQLAHTATNLISPGTAATIEGDLGFVADRYVRGAVDAKVDTGVAIPAAHFTRDAAFMLARQVSATTDNQNPLIGTSQGRSSVSAMTTDERVRFNANATVEDDSVGQIPNGVGTFGWIRDSATHFQPMIGSVAHGDPVARDSASITTVGNTMQLMAAGAQFATGDGAYWACGGAVSTAWYAGFVHAMERHIRRIGTTL